MRRFSRDSVRPLGFWKVGNRVDELGAGRRSSATASASDVEPVVREAESRPSARRARGGSRASGRSTAPRRSRSRPRRRSGAHEVEALERPGRQHDARRIDVVASREPTHAAAVAGRRPVVQAPVRVLPRRGERAGPERLGREQIGSRDSRARRRSRPCRHESSRPGLRRRLARPTASATSWATSVGFVPTRTPYGLERLLLRLGRACGARR